MESYKIRPDDATGQIPTFLLPISFGVSSTTLLHLIDAQLQGQRLKKATRTRYRLKILHVDETVLDPSAAPPPQHLDKVRHRFPDAGEFLSAKLEDIYGFPSQTEALGGSSGGGGGSSNAESMRALLSALPSPTSREDMAGIIRTRLIVAVANREGCRGILWGDSTTRLADKVMAEAAKGRGFSLPWQISDSESPYGQEISPPKEKKRDGEEKKRRGRGVRGGEGGGRLIQSLSQAQHSSIHSATCSRRSSSPTSRKSPIRPFSRSAWHTRRSPSILLPLPPADGTSPWESC